MILSHMRPKIIHIPRRFVKENWGGTETVITGVSRELVKAGYDVEIRTSLALSEKRHEEIYELSVTRYSYFYTYFGLGKDNKAALDEKGGNLVSLSLFFSLLFSKGVTLFHLHTMGRLGGVVRTVSRFRHIPYIVSIHGGVLDVPKEESEEYLKPVRGLLDWGKIFGAVFGSRKVLRDAAAIICLGKKEHKLLEDKFPGKKVIYIGNGVDLNKFERGAGAAFRKKYAINEAEKVFLCVARIAPQKNQRLLLEVFKDLAENRTALRLVLVGAVTNSLYFEELKAMIQRHDVLKERVTVLTQVEFDNEDLVNAYAAADIFILPSQHEPFGIVILEAWAAKKPVIASNVGGIIDLVADGKSAILFESGSRTSLKAAILKLLDDPGLSRALAANGYEEAKKRSWAAISEKLISLYKEVSAR